MNIQMGLLLRFGVAHSFRTFNGALFLGLLVRLGVGTIQSECGQGTGFIGGCDGPHTDRATVSAI